MMHAAIATLQKAARQFERSGDMDGSRCSRIMAQLRDVDTELDTVERRRGHREADAIDLIAILREAAAVAGRGADGVVVQLTEEATVAGPAGDLRELVSCLLDYALAVGRGGTSLRTQIRHVGKQARPVCATELTISSAEVPDFLRRRLWDAVRVRRGEVSIVSEPDCCRVEFTLPIERRRPEAAFIPYPGAA
jgi:hypothetical protein